MWINLKGDDIHQKVHVSCLLYSLDKYKDLFQEQMKTNQLSKNRFQNLNIPNNKWKNLKNLNINYLKQIIF